MLFLTRSALYRVIQRELPEDVYPDAGDPSRFWSTADSDAEAEVLANAYARLNQVWDNYWPQTADADGIAQHEVLRFGSLSNDLALQDRRDRVVTRVRSLPSLSRADLTEIVAAELPAGTYVEIVNWGADSDGGIWFIGDSELGAGTILGGFGASLYPIGTDLCQKDGGDVGMSPTEWAAYQASAYTYDVRIYEYTPTADESAAIERELTPAEPSMSEHNVRANVALTEVVNPYLPAMLEPGEFLPLMVEP